MNEVRRVEADAWREAVSAARSAGWAQFDCLTAVDELGREQVFRILLRLIRPDRPAEGLVLQTVVPREAAALDSIAAVFAGAAWHEREVAGNFGMSFIDGDPRPLLVRPEYGGHPLRKDEVLGARSAKPWPGAKEPGEAAAAGRRRMVPPGVPDPSVWGERQGPAATPDDIVASASGGRVRRRP